MAKRMIARCKVCRKETAHDEYYMVHDSVWDEAEADRGCLCVGYLENRLGRQLDRHDFPMLPVNLDNVLYGRWSARLRDRMDGEELVQLLKDWMDQTITIATGSIPT
jgi:hypothetical protein